MGSQLILLALFVIAVILEAVLFIAKDFLFGVHRAQSIEAQIKQTQKDVEEAAGRVRGKRKVLMGHYDECEKVVAAQAEIDKELAAMQRVRPVLVHPVGQASPAKRFRAKLTKSLPENADSKQTLIWGFDNFVETWAETPQAARDAALRQFAPEAGYTLGEFTAQGAAAQEQSAASQAVSERAA